MLKTITATAFILVALVGSASAQNPAPGFIALVGMSVCAKVEDTTKRLDCFDKLSIAAREATSSKTAEKPPAKAEKVAGVWDVTSEKARIDSTAEVIASTVTIEPVLYQFGSGNATLAVVCARGQTNAFVVWENPIAFGETAIPARIRFDDASPVRSSLSISSNYRGTGRFGTKQSVPFISQMLAAKTMTVEVTGRTTVTATFDLTGMAEAIAPVRAACKW